MASVQLPSGSAAGRPTLALYIGESCDSCRAALEVAERAGREFPHIDVRVVDLSVSSEQRPDGVFAVPTFLLDGEVVSLGTPSWNRLAPLLRATMGDREGS